MTFGKIISNPPVKWALSLIFLALVLYFNFFLERTSFSELILLYAGMFVLYVLFVQQRYWPFKGYMKWMMGIAVLSRLMLLFSFPNLSDDIFRFIWDGRLLAAGIHPFEYTPSEWMTMISHLPIAEQQAWSDLFPKLNSPNYYSVYPPVNQFVFWMATSLFPNSLEASTFVIKFMVISADILLIFLLYKVSLENHASTMPALLYALNPLVIMEFSGNLHFEGMMLMFLVLSLYFIKKDKSLFAALSFAAAVLVKLHPFMLLPFFMKFLGWKKGVRFAGVSVLISFGCMMLFLSLGGDLSLHWAHFLTSLRLYFQTFEFNAGLYYLMRSVGTQHFGYNPIQLNGQILFGLQLILLLILFIRQQKEWHWLVFSIAYGYFGYYLFSTTVHPWYILTMLPFALLIGFRTPLVWTAAIVVSYFAYSTPDWHENFYLLSLEYTCIFVFLIWEMWNRTRVKSETGIQA